MMTLHRLFAVFLVALMTSACVTIHIYFPAAAAEEAARTIVREVLELPEARDPAPSSRVVPAGQTLPLLARVLDRLIPPAAAQTPDIRVETAAINRLRASMRARNAELAPYLRSGAVCFGRDGFVAARDLSAVPLRERAQVQRLVSEENADRSALYREVARANDRPDWETNIRETFARVWLEEAPAEYACPR